MVGAFLCPNPGKEVRYGGSRIKGITIEIGGDTTKLQTALKGVNSEIKNTQSQQDVEKLLKYDALQGDHRNGRISQKAVSAGKSVCHCCAEDCYC